MQADEALARLKKGNEAYCASGQFSGDVSPEARSSHAAGQSPYAVIVSCADSRVIPEALFSAGIGELFVIRVAGNIVGKHELGSIEYAVGHLGCRLVVVLGHTHCGAVGATLAGGADGHTAAITTKIAQAIGEERDGRTASWLNAADGARTVHQELSAAELSVVPALFDIETGTVSWEAPL